MRVQREGDEEDETNVEEMVEFLEGIEEPLDSQPLRDCIEDLRGLGELTKHLREDVEEIDEFLAGMIDKLEEELDRDEESSES